MKFDLYDIIEGLSNATGNDFYNRIALTLNETIGAEYTIIARMDDEKHSAQTLSLVDHGELGKNFSYVIKGTPCERIARDELCCYPRDVQSIYPENQMYKDLGIQGYIGAPLKNLPG